MTTCTCICARFPAVMLEMVQQASFLMDSLVLESRWRRQGRAEQFNTTCVWMSSPVTMLPTALRAADTTPWDTNLGQTQGYNVAMRLLKCICVLFINNYWITKLGSSLRSEWMIKAQQDWKLWLYPITTYILNKLNRFLFYWDGT